MTRPLISLTALSVFSAVSPLSAFAAPPLISTADSSQANVSTQASGQQVAPNILLIVADDLGYSDVGAFGGEIETPAIDDLAAAGTTFSNFHVTPACAMTRAQLLTGHDHHLTGLGSFPKVGAPNQRGKPGYEGFLNQRVSTVAEVLKPAGYTTLFSGKWHLATGDRSSPTTRGFDRSFDFTAGNTDHFAITTKPILDGKLAESVPDDFFSSNAITDAMLGFINEHEPSKPFFAYLSFNAPHYALQAPDDVIDKYASKYDAGYAPIQRQRLNAMRQKGLIADSPPPSRMVNLEHRWAALSHSEQQIQARAMEVYAAMVDNMDQNIERVIRHLKTTGQYSNTLIIFMSDNGAAKTGMATNIVKLGAKKLAKQLRVAGKEVDNSLKNMGRKGSWVAYGPAWAEVSNTPFRHFKHTTSEGGIRVPLIVGGGYLQQATSLNHHYASVLDIVPTLLDAANAPYPSTAPNGDSSLPLGGHSILPATLSNSPIQPTGEIQGWELAGDRALYHAPWKAVFLLNPAGNENWELYKLDEDPFEHQNLASEHTKKLAELAELWQQYAESTGVILPEGRNVIKLLISDEPLPDDFNAVIQQDPIDQQR